ncbi:MAG: transposase, partial [Bacillota bacterium]
MSVPAALTTYVFRAATCQKCPLREGCYSGSKHGRTVTVYEPNAAQEAAKLRQETAEAREASQRRRTIEHKFAELKRFCGLHRARYRSLLRVFLQAVMACFVANAKRMAKLEACAYA